MSYQSQVAGIQTRVLFPSRLQPVHWVLEMQGIGYGVEVNALQVARAYAALATGRMPELSLLADASPAAVDLDVSPEDLRVVQDGLRACVLSGTASRVSGLQGSGLEIHGKTGTAEISKDPERNNAWFAGFIGRDEGASIAFAAVAYQVTGHGADVAGEMIAEFIAQAAASSATAGYLQR